MPLPFPARHGTRQNTDAARRHALVSLLAAGAKGVRTFCRGVLVALLVVATTSQSMAAFVHHGACRHDVGSEMITLADRAASDGSEGTLPCHEAPGSAESSSPPVDGGCNGDCRCPMSAGFCLVTVTGTPVLHSAQGEIPFSLIRIDALAPDRRWRPPAA